MQPLNEGSQKSVMIIDDHPIVREGLARLINMEKDFRCIHLSGDCEDALRKIEQETPQLIVMDLTLGDGFGLELLKDIRVRWPEVRVLVFSMHDEKIYAERVLRAGARGYIMKENSADSLVDALRRILRGEIILSDQIKSHILQCTTGLKRENERTSLGSLSDRELEVFQLLGQGYSIKEIAGRLKLSVKTVETYRTSTREKMGFGKSSQLHRFAIQWMGQQYPAPAMTPIAGECR